ncbi:MAG: hypothetical protein V1859_00820 [archaeon]
MNKLKKIFSNVRIWIYLFFFVLMIVSISPIPWHEGATIRTITTNSSAFNAGMASAKPNQPPMSRETIIKINEIPIKNEIDLQNALLEIEPNSTVFIETLTRRNLIFSDKKNYILEARPKIKVITLNETYIKTFTEELFDPLTNRTANFTKSVRLNKTREEVLGIEDLGIKAYSAPKTNIKLGLDLQGGTRVVLQPEEKVTPEDVDTLIESMSQRLNLYGLSDVIIRSAGDLSGSQFIVVEIAGANEEEVRELLAKQGKFEAKIGNDTVFLGGKDITYVCRSAQCSGIDPMYGCSQSSNGGYACRFRFSISLNPDAAKKQAMLTEKLDSIFDESGQEYLSQDLSLYLDDSLVDTLRISSELKGQEATDIAISGSGVGADMSVARTDALKNMKKLQTVLITGSLPVKLNIIKTDSISPSLGTEFLANALLIGLLSMAAVSLIVYLRYRKIKVSIPIIVVITSEIILILGVSAIMGQNLDIASIAGIIVAIGTGVNDQIIITDETLRKEKDSYSNWKEKFKRAFFIVMAAYFATTASMLPLLFAGAGLLRGFAITTIIGVTNGVLITRPAFSEMIKILLEDEE